jgi:hypothetical protein
VAGIYSLFLYKRNIEPTVKSRHNLPQGAFRELCGYMTQGGGHIPTDFLFSKRRGSPRAKTGNQRGYMQKNKQRRFFYEKAGN